MQGSDSESFYINIPHGSFFFFSLRRLQLSQKSRRQSRAAAATTGQTCNHSAFAQQHAEPTAKTLLRMNTHFLISSRCAPSESNVVAEWRNCVSVSAVSSQRGPSARRIERIARSLTLAGPLWKKMNQSLSRSRSGWSLCVTASSDRCESKNTLAGDSDKHESVKKNRISRHFPRTVGTCCYQHCFQVWAGREGV